MPRWTMVQAIHTALAQELAADRRVCLFGEDVGHNGGVFRVTDGLQDEFGEERVFDTPLAEAAIAGTAVGMAVYGLRPIVEMQFIPFAAYAFAQIVTQAARMRYRSGGVFSVPLVIRGPFGGGVRTPEMHSDNLEAIFAHVQGVKVVIPSGPYDAKGLLHAAVADPDPVIFMEHMKLYRSIREEVPEERYEIPLGKANLVKAGADLTVISYGAMVHAARSAIAIVEAQRPGTTIELLDLGVPWWCTRRRAPAAWEPRSSPSSTSGRFTRFCVLSCALPPQTRPFQYLPSKMQFSHRRSGSPGPFWLPWRSDHASLPIA
jgi:pyruvate dehydrogenase E1 component beta subunit